MKVELAGAHAQQQGGTPVTLPALTAQTRAWAMEWLTDPQVLGVTFRHGMIDAPGLRSLADIDALIVRRMDVLYPGGFAGFLSDAASDEAPWRAPVAPEPVSLAKPGDTPRVPDAPRTGDIELTGADGSWVTYESREGFRTMITDALRVSQYAYASSLSAMIHNDPVCGICLCTVADLNAHWEHCR